MNEYVPDRGDAIWLNFNPQAGHEHAGHRPAFVLSPRAYNEQAGLALCCPITSKIKGYPFEVLIEGSKQVEGVILADQVKSLDWRHRKARLIDSLPSSIALETLKKLDVLLRIST